MTSEELYNSKTVQAKVELEKQMAALQESMRPAVDLLRQIKLPPPIRLPVIEDIRHRLQPFVNLAEQIQRQTEPLAKAIQGIQAQTRLINESLERIQIDVQPYTRALREFQTLAERISINPPLALTLGDAYQHVLQYHRLALEEGKTDAIEAELCSNCTKSAAQD